MTRDSIMLYVYVLGYVCAKCLLFIIILSSQFFVFILHQSLYIMYPTAYAKYMHNLWVRLDIYVCAFVGVYVRLLVYVRACRWVGSYIYLTAWECAYACFYILLSKHFQARWIHRLTWKMSYRKRRSLWERRKWESLCICSHARACKTVCWITDRQRKSQKKTNWAKFRQISDSKQKKTS